MMGYSLTPPPPAPVNASTPAPPPNTYAPGSNPNLAMLSPSYAQSHGYYGPTAPSAGNYGAPLSGSQVSGLLGLFQNAAQAGSKTDLWAANQRYGIGMQDIANQRGTLNRQLPLLGAEYGLTQQGYGLQHQGIGTQRADIGIDAARARYEAMRQKQEQTGAAAAQGARTSVGEGRKEGDIRRNLADTLAHQAQEQRRLSLQDQGITLDSKRARLEYNESRAKIGDGLAQLGLRAKELGVSLGEAQRRLQDALNTSGLSAFMSVSDILQGIGSASGDRQKQILAMLPGLGG